MRNIVSMIVVALAAVGMAEAKPEVRPIVQVEVGVQKPMPKFKHGKRHVHKHHARPHRCHKHGVRPMPHMGKKRHFRKPMMHAPVARPVHK